MIDDHSFVFVGLSADYLILKSKPLYGFAKVYVFVYLKNTHAVIYLCMALRLIKSSNNFFDIFIYLFTYCEINSPQVLYPIIKIFRID